jgi:hypothetical protein
MKVMPGIFSLSYFMHIQEEKWKSYTMMEKTGRFHLLNFNLNKPVINNA